MESNWVRTTSGQLINLNAAVSVTATPNGQLYDVALVNGTTAQLARDTAASVWPLAQVSAARPADIVPGSTPGTDRLNTDSMRTMLMESARKVGPVLDILKE